MLFLAAKNHQSEKKTGDKNSMLLFETRRRQIKNGKIGVNWLK